eukprot:12936025-Prorocentrum_lima.AAC.1
MARSGQPGGEGESRIIGIWRDGHLISIPVRLGKARGDREGGGEDDTRGHGSRHRELGEGGRGRSRRPPREGKRPRGGGGPTQRGGRERGVLDELDHDLLLVVKLPGLVLQAEDLVGLVCQL